MDETNPTAGPEAGPGPNPYRKALEEARTAACARLAELEARQKVDVAEIAELRELLGEEASKKPRRRAAGPASGSGEAKASNAPSVLEAAVLGLMTAHAAVPGGAPWSMKVFRKELPNASAVDLATALRNLEKRHVIEHPGRDRYVPPSAT